MDTATRHPGAELMAAAHALARASLVDAFGHVSTRHGPGGLLITPAAPLGSLAPDAEPLRVPLDASELPAGAPPEAWMHVAVLRGRPEAGAVCRAQPPVATALTAAGVEIWPLHGQGAFLGPTVPVFDDAVLVRDARRGAALAGALGAAPALVLRGNGAVTVGATVAEAVALMWVLEASARMNRDALAAGSRRPLREDEQAAWRAAAPELLARIWTYLQGQVKGVENA